MHQRQIADTKAKEKILKAARENAKLYTKE